MQDIHPIKPPVMVGMDPALVKLVLAIAGGLALLALVILLVRRFWKSRGKQSIPELIPEIPPYDQALRELDRLSLKPVLDPKLFYFDVSALVKRYIGRSYGIHALEMTSQELIKQIRFTPMDKALITRLAHFQNFSDPFRYGPLPPEPAQVQKDLVWVRQMVMDMEQDLESRRIKQEAS